MKQWLKKYWWLPLCILFAFSLPVFVNTAFLLFHFNTGAELNNATWLGFWGSYLGGLLSSVAALIALYLTYRQQERYHKEAKESDRLRVLPVAIASMCAREEAQKTTYSCIAVDQNGKIKLRTMNSKELVHQFETSDSPGTYLSHIEIKNIGLGPALDVRISTDGQNTNSAYSENIGPLGIGESKLCIFRIPKNTKFVFTVHCKDVFSNVYSTKCIVAHTPGKSLISFTPSTAPVLESST